MAEEVKPAVSEVKKGEVATTPVASEPKLVKEESKPAMAEKPAETEKKVVEGVKREEPKVVVSPEETEKKEEKPVAEAPATLAEKGEEDVFEICPIGFVLKTDVIGQVDLTALNQSTRPKKKSKKEKRKEREEKEKPRQDQKKQMREAIIEEIHKEGNRQAKVTGKENLDPNGKKRRNHISNSEEKIDVDNVAFNFVHPTPNSKRTNNNRGGDQQSDGGQNRNRSGNSKDRFKKPVVKQEVSEEDAAKRVRETLAHLASKGRSKGAKYRKERRDLAPNRMQELGDQEMAESKVLKLTELVTVNELVSMTSTFVDQVIGTCMSIGMMVSINQRLDVGTINLIAEEFGLKIEYVDAEVAQAIVEEGDALEDLEHRAPIVTVVGHVDHGKTSLFDYIRRANIAAGEAEGITQHVGAHHATLEDRRKTIFLNTPGHEALTAVRARGAKVTGTAIIIVAVDNDVMSQTKEAINHTAAAGVPIVFAIDKIDKPHANLEKIKGTLTQMNYLVKEWGGKYQSQDVSARKSLGVLKLMERALLEAEMLDLKANPNRNVTGPIIESTPDKGRGYVITVLASDGTLKVGDIVLAGASYGRVETTFNGRN